MLEVSFKIAGDMALNVEFGNEISEDIVRWVLALAKKLKENPIKGVTECVPTYRSLLIYYDPCLISHRYLLHSIKKYISYLNIMDKKEKRIHLIPVCYGGEYGKDIGYVCKHVNMSEEDVILMHSSKDYLIYMLGFLPGFAYLGGLNESLVTPRLENPRTRIPAGSVGIGGNQTGIYPIVSPGGWRLIGRTPMKPYDPLREQIILYEAGDYIRFVPITPEKFRMIEQEVNEGTYRHQMIRAV